MKRREVGTAQSVVGILKCNDTHHGLAALAALDAQQRLLVGRRDAGLAGLGRLSALRASRQRIKTHASQTWASTPVCRAAACNRA